MGSKFYFDPDASGARVFLGPTEAPLMELAWKHGKLTVKKAQSLLSGNNRTYTTCMTVLTRLYRKGWLVRERDRRNFVYRPALDYEDFIVNRLNTIKKCVKKNFIDEP